MILDLIFDIFTIIILINYYKNLKMFIGTIFGILGIADIAFFIKNISKYK